ncbi:FeoB-associated Cys-rich membrane protein [Treponema bryantii]|uniref:FeoB-associated Cys-rich membrane protein n=1 Tax=Treponema bryantii TaxID=163 RepID=UPI0003B4DB6B|nr:FeoB-associated Cys-rich membrane protein [Treponema bryantii]
MGTLIVSIILLAIVVLVIHSLIKSKRSGRHPSCGGNCGTCGHVCKAAYPHSTSFLNNHTKKAKKDCK